MLTPSLAGPDLQQSRASNGGKRGVALAGVQQHRSYVEAIHEAAATPAEEAQQGR